MVDANTLKQLLVGLTAIEAGLPYNNNNFDVMINSISLDTEVNTPVVLCLTKADFDSGIIPVIKSIRTCKGNGLKEAKDEAEFLRDRNEPVLLGAYPTKLIAMQTWSEMQIHHPSFIDHSISLKVQ
jgi:hypothetical protein